MRPPPATRSSMGRPPVPSGSDTYCWSTSRRLEGCDADELRIDADQLVLTTGSQQLLSIVCEILLDPGDICLVAGPTYFVFLGNLDGVGANVVTVETDDGGMKPEALDAALAQIAGQGQLDRVKLIYLVSYYDNPSGRCLAAERRGPILDIARKWSRDQRILILEDAAYRELRYDGPKIPSIWKPRRSARFGHLHTDVFEEFQPGAPRRLRCCSFGGGETPL